MLFCGQLFNVCCRCGSNERKKRKKDEKKKNNCIQARFPMSSAPSITFAHVLRPCSTDTNSHTQNIDYYFSLFHLTDDNDDERNKMYIPEGMDFGLAVATATTAFSCQFRYRNNKSQNTQSISMHRNEKFVQ